MLENEEPFSPIDRALESAIGFSVATIQVISLVVQRVQDTAVELVSGETPERKSDRIQRNLESLLIMADHEAGHLLVSILMGYQPNWIFLRRLPMDLLKALQPFVEVGPGEVEKSESNSPLEKEVTFPRLRETILKFPSVKLTRFASGDQEMPTLPEEVKKLNPSAQIRHILCSLAGLAAEEVEKETRVLTPPREFKNVYTKNKKDWKDVALPRSAVEHIIGRKDEEFLELCVYDMYQSLVEFLSHPLHRQLLNVLSFYGLERGGKVSGDLTSDITDYAEEKGTPKQAWLEARQAFDKLADGWVDRLSAMRTCQ